MLLMAGLPVNITNVIEISIFLKILGTEFGVVLDMITDRASTALILIVLSDFYKEYRFYFMCFIALDFCSHWLQMYS
jgi:phosphatidylglycerophosphate synthase